MPMGIVRVRVRIFNINISTLLLVIILSMINGLCWGQEEEEECITGMYAFGDSLTDTGNCLIDTDSRHLPSPIGNLPYGETYFGYPTGRCSDGRLLIDFMAQQVGIDALPPYLKVTRNMPPTERRHGVNFAVAGATSVDSKRLLLDYSTPSFTSSGLGTQLGWLRNLITSSMGNDGGHFTRALYVIGEIGGNDYLYSIISGKSIDQIKGLVPAVVEEVKKTMQELVMNMGVKYLVVQGMPPLGCIPSLLSITVGAEHDSNGCLVMYNEVAQAHNVLLVSAIEEIGKKSGIKIVYNDYYEAFIEVITDKSRWNQTIRACCGSGAEPYHFSFAGLCGNKISALPVTVCPDPSSYIHWDGIHLTEAAYRFIAGVFESSLNALPRKLCSI